MKIYIVSGFLGAGKTTFLKKILPGLPGKTVLIENEFGDVGLDGDMLLNNNLPVYEIYAGCICCSLAMDFQKAICQIAENEKADQIIIEPSGIGKLSDVVLSYERAKQEKNLDLSIGHLITIVDATLFNDYREVFGDFYLDQICNADVIFLSHIKDFKAEDLSRLISDLQAVNPKAAIYEKDWLDLPAEEVYSFLNELDAIEQFDVNNQAALPIGKHFVSFSSLQPKNFTKAELEQVLGKLQDTAYGQVLRGKGIVEDSVGNKYHFDFTPGSCCIDLITEDLANKIVIIGCALRGDLLRALFEVGK